MRKQGLRFVSCLLLIAMLATLQPFAINAQEETSESAVESLDETTVEEIQPPKEESIDSIAEVIEAIEEEQITAEVIDEETPVNTTSDDDTEDYVVTPFMLDVTEKESVGLVSGALTYTEPLLTLSNVGELDCNLSLLFDSSRNNVSIPSGSPVVRSSSKFFYLGAGWSFSIPFISGSTLYLPDMGEYDFDSGYELYDANRNEIDLRVCSDEEKTTYNASAVLIYANGTKVYFSSGGYPVKRIDRYGNYIAYEYTTLFNNYPCLSRITDSENREIGIEYATTASGYKITVTAPDQNTIELYTESYFDGEDHVGYLLEEIKFSDSEKIDIFNEVKLGNSSSFNSEVYRTFPTKILYSSGAYIEYTFESEMSYSYKQRAVNARLLSRASYKNSDDETSYDITEYEYDHNMTWADDVTYIKQYFDDTEYIDTYTFDLCERCASHEVSKNGSLLQKTSYEYDSRRYVKKEQIDYYGSEIKTVINRYEHDVYGNLIYVLSPKAEGSTSKTYYETTYTFSTGNTSLSATNYNLPLSVTYRQNYNTTVKIENTLTADKKSIATTIVYVNNTPMSKTEYTYDTCGRVLTERVYTNLASETFTEKVYTYSNGNLASATVNNVTDNDGNTASITTSYTYDVMGRLLSVTDANANATEGEEKPKTVYTYDGRGRTVKVVNPDGSYTDYVYNIASNITTVDHSLLEAVVYDYDSFGKLETMRLANGTVVSECLYDENGRLISEATNSTSSAAATTCYTYDVFDRVLEKAVYNVDDELVYRETCEYDDAYTDSLSLVTKTIHGDENAADIVTKTYINKYGETVKEDIGGVVTEYAYDYVSNPIRIFYGDTTLITYTYDHFGNVLAETNAVGDTRSLVYDAAGRKISESDYKGNVTSYTYDAAGRILTMTSPFADGVNTVIKYYYDANGNVTKQQQTAHADNSAEALWRTVEYKYDNMNRVTDITNYISDTLKQYTHYTYDAAGNLTHVYTGMTQEWSAILNPNTYRLVTYTYDSRGNNVAVTDAANESESYTYDVLGMLTSAVLRDGTDISYTYSPLGMIGDSISVGDEVVSSSVTEYTATGAVRSVTLDGVTVYYTYDGLGNVLTETEGRFVKTYTYDSRGRKSGYTLSMDGEAISTAVYTYDVLDRLISVTEGGKTTTYTYDENGNRESQTTDGVTAVYTYNNANLVTAMTNSIGELTISQFAYTYYLDGNIRTKTEIVGVTTSNTAYVYDGVGRLVSETRDGTTIAYEYDSHNNRTRMTAGGVVTTYSYDNNNRIINENSPDKLITYSYDENGNTHVATSYYTEAHQFEEGVCLLCGEPELCLMGDTTGDGIINQDDITAINQYMAGELLIPDILAFAADVDIDGEITEWDIQIIEDYISNGISDYYVGTYFDNYTDCNRLEKYTYNAREQQCEYTDGFIDASYVYNPSGLRSAKTVGGSTKYFIYNGSQIVYEYDDLGGTSYYYGLNRTHNSNGEIYVYNAHGDTVQLVKDGAVTATYTYDAFGNLISQAGESDNPFKYCGEYFDEETETYYLRARYYTPANGRFTAEDPHWNAYNCIYGDNPFKIYEYEDALGLSKYTLLPSISAILQSNNLYVYCSNNPIMHVDSSGEAHPEACGGGGGGLAISAIGYATLVYGASQASQVQPPVYPNTCSNAHSDNSYPPDNIVSGIGTVVGVVNSQVAYYTVSNNSGNAGVEIAPPPEDPDQKPNWQKVNDRYLKQNDIDAHKLKEEVVGKNNISHFDIYVDKNTGELFVFRKGGGGAPIPTGEFIK